MTFRMRSNLDRIADLQNTPQINIKDSVFSKNDKKSPFREEMRKDRETSDHTFNQYPFDIQTGYSLQFPSPRYQDRTITKEFVVTPDFTPRTNTFFGQNEKTEPKFRETNVVIERGEKGQTGEQGERGPMGERGKSGEKVLFMNVNQEMSSQEKRETTFFYNHEKHKLRCVNFIVSKSQNFSLFLKNDSDEIIASVENLSEEVDSWKDMEIYQIKSFADTLSHSKFISVYCVSKQLDAIPVLVSMEFVFE
jgi:hypothetical protein